MDRPASAAPATFIAVRPPPPFPAPPRSVDFSALEFILGFIAVISIPVLIYTFFFSINCRRHSSGAGAESELSAAVGRESPAPTPAPAPTASDVKYSREIHAKDLGGECSVCLSAFGDGDEVKRLSACGHAFHGECVDTWLREHPSCPYCRAAVAAAAKPAGGGNSGGNGRRSSRNREDDFHQGLPDASNLV